MDIGSLDSYLNQYQSTLQTSKTADSISKMSQNGLKNASDDELMDVCKQFESYFLEQIFYHLYIYLNLPNYSLLIYLKNIFS